MIILIINALKTYGLELSFFRLIEYPTFRIIMGMLTALFISVILGHKIVVTLYRINFRDTSGDYMSIDSTTKKGTPTAGGLIFILSMIISAILWVDLTNKIILCLLYGSLFSAIIGFVDDYLKIRFKSSLSGLSQKGKTLALLIMIIPIVIFFVSEYNPLPLELRTKLFVPFYKHPILDLGRVGYSLFMIFFMFSLINAVNITDGLDGLLSGVSLTPLIVFTILAFIIGQEPIASHYLYPFMPEVIEVAIFSSIFIASLIGFIWYNAYPASVFMGDTGSLVIGTNLSIIIFFTKQEILFLIVGGIFIFEIFTSLVQEKFGNHKKFGRRFFYRAPYHHTLIHKGIPEPKAVTKLVLISIILGLIALLSIKVR